MHGVVRGRTIELDQDTGFPEGQSVLVLLRPSIGEQKENEGLQRAFGGWGEEADSLDEYLRWNQQQRKISRLESEP